MNNLSQTFEALKKSNQAALIPFLTAGYPDPKTFEKLLLGVIDAGADLVEIGIPFSDPLADGPTIQFSSHLALENGTTLSGTLSHLEKISSKVKVPLVIMSYYNPIREFGTDRFLDLAYQANVRGLIVPDMIIEESPALEQKSKNKNIDLIHLIAPTTTAARSKIIAKRSNGFVYLVSVAGVTGSRKQLPSTLGKWTRSIKKIANNPVCVGFGISNPELAAEVAGYADGVIMGSAIIDIIRKADSKKKAIVSVCRFISKVRKAMDDTRS